MSLYELRDGFGSTIGLFESLCDARAEAVASFGPDTDINDMDANGRALIWLNSEDSHNDDGYLACGVILELQK